MSRPALVFPLVMGALFGSLLLLGGPPLMILVVVAIAFGMTIMAQPLRGFLLFCLIAPVIPWTTVTLGIRMTVSEALLALTWAGVFWQWLMGQIGRAHV